MKIKSISSPGPFFLPACLPPLPLGGGGTVNLAKSGLSCVSSAISGTFLAALLPPLPLLEPDIMYPSSSNSSSSSSSSSVLSKDRIATEVMLQKPRYICGCCGRGESRHPCDTHAYLMRIVRRTSVSSAEHPYLVRILRIACAEFK